MKHPEYEKLVNYVNCRYIVAFIDKKIEQQSTEINDKYKSEYTDIHRPKLYVNSYKNAPDYKEIKIAVGKYQKAEMLAGIINDKKSKFNESWTNDEIISALITLPTDKPSEKGGGFDGYLREVVTLLGNDLKQQLIIKSVTERRNRKDSNSSPLFGQWLLWILIIGFVAALVFRYRKEFAKQNRTEPKHDSPESPDKEINGLNNIDINQLKKIVKELIQKDTGFRDFVKSLLSYEKPEIAKTPVTTPATKDEECSPSNAYLYANAIIDGAFNKVTGQANENTIYIILRKNATDKIAGFTVYSNCYGRVIACPDLIDGCYTQHINDRPATLRVENGTVAQDDSGKWKVMKKAKVEFV
jgi:hypothetical protein